MNSLFSLEKGQTAQLVPSGDINGTNNFPSKAATASLYKDMLLYF
jgi:hypothetical protein